jgi:hypothetical protein
MIKLDDDLLQELGLSALPPEEKKKLLAHIYETLEMRVGMKLAEQMSDDQLSEFEQFIQTNDEAGALNWLETKFPHYKDVVASEFDALKSEVGQVAPQILSAANTNNGGQPQDGGQPQMMPPQQGANPMMPQQGFDPGMQPQGGQPMGAPQGFQQPMAPQGGQQPMPQDAYQQQMPPQAYPQQPPQPQQDYGYNPQQMPQQPQQMQPPMPPQTDPNAGAPGAWPAPADPNAMGQQPGQQQQQMPPAPWPQQPQQNDQQQPPQQQY